jgi:hypothetical protein
VGIEGIVLKHHGYVPLAGRNVVDAAIANIKIASRGGL